MVMQDLVFDQKYRIDEVKKIPLFNIYIHCGNISIYIEVNKNRKIRSFESKENTQRQSVGHIAQFRIINPHQ